MSIVIEVENLVKRYGEVTAVAGVDFTVREGDVVALLGPNGAGKTTLVEMLEGYRRADEGRIEVLGRDPGSAGRGFRDRIGIVLQETGIEQNLRVREAIDYYGSAYSRRLPAGGLISLVGLEEKAGAKIKTLSGGQKRRLDLALGLVGDPDLVFLDEPTTGFDPSARRRSWELIESLTSMGKTILLTTHYLDEAQHLADRVIVLSKGRIAADGAPDSIGTGPPITTVSFKAADPSGLPGLETEPSVDRGTVSYRTCRPTALLHELTAWAVEQGVELEGIEVVRPSLEDIYLEIVDEEDAGAADGAADG